ncbi:hypothetical protein SME46J_11250 [Serratia marcescens]|nr:hypothetical protein SME46J_11250 [Serratia marcescens]
MLSVGIVSENLFFREAVKRILTPRIYHQEHVITCYGDLPLVMGSRCHDILVIDDAVKSMLRFSVAVTLLPSIHGIKFFIATEEMRRLLCRSFWHDVVVFDKRDSVSNMSQSLALLLADILRCSASPQKIDDRPVRAAKHCLTESEAETLHLLSFGYTVTQVSKMLDKSVKTVSTQKCSALRKMGLENRVHNLLGISSGFIRER